MNINTNYGSASFNYKANNQKPMQSTINTTPAFTGSSKKGIKITLGLIAGALGIKTVSNKVAANKPKETPSITMPQKTDQIENVSVRVVGGDMTKIKADAYFVPQFTSCASEGGVGGAIMYSGAQEGMEEYNKYIEENGEMAWGDVIMTKSGGGNSQFLLHGATAGANKEDSFEVAQKATYKALQLAQEAGLKSVVIPAIGTGIIGSLTNEESAKAILSGVNQFAQEGGNMDVSVVVYSTGQGYKDFENVLTSKSYENAQPTIGTKEFEPEKFMQEMQGVNRQTV